MGREADYSSPSSAQVKNAWNCTSTPQYGLMAWNFVKDRDNFALNLSLCLTTYRGIKTHPALN